LRARDLRGFRRLEGALGQLVAACRTGNHVVTPEPRAGLRLAAPVTMSSRRSPERGAGSSKGPSRPVVGRKGCHRAALCDVNVWTEPLPPPHALLWRKVASCDGLMSLLADKRSPCGTLDAIAAIYAK
jgi:hypothetical protein